ncbi:MAG TPA: EAL domain-containing protein [Azonexus sp.]|nr:EAL domain-containing protein [Azonexus sp.]
MSRAESEPSPDKPAGHKFAFANGQRPLILVVDDLPDNLATLAEMVHQEGADVRVANSGAVALRYARLEPRPDLILLDIMMPEMDGHAVLRALKQDEMTRHIPVIFVTALGDQIDEQRGLDEGAADYITKPVRNAVLIARVRAQLELKQARDLQTTQKQWLEEEVQRRVSENAQLESRLQLALEGSGFGIWELDHGSGRLEWNAALDTLFGLDDGPQALTEFLARVHPEDLARAEQSFRRLHTERGVVLAEYRVRHQDGRWIWVECRAKVVRRAASDAVEQSLGTLTDITQRKAAEADRLLTGMVFQRIRDGICITDGQSNILLVNEAFTQVTGYQSSEVIGRTPALLKSGVHSAAFYQDIWDKINRYGNWQGEITNRRKDGSLYTEWLNVSALKNPDGAVTHFVAIFSDLSERREAAERIQYLSSYDSLTGLPNRSLFADRLEQSLLNARRFERGTAVILLDLDRFRVINDTLGPPTGDEVLIEVARRLSLQVREGDTVGRRGGNEFGFVMGSLGHERDAISLAQRMLEAISVPVVVNGKSVTITASIGISVAPKNGEGSADLLKCADIALLRAKEGGRNTFRFYSPEMDADAARRLGLEVALRGALDRQEMSVHYQPQISLDSGQMLGMEALLRWHNPDFGQVSPLEFIAIAEENGLIIPIGEWVLRTACLQTKAWRDLGLVPLRVAVNLSARQFRQPNLIAMVGSVLAETGLPASALELEITENAFIDDVEQAVSICRELKQLGVKLSLDDFGTGYSSLAYVSRFPFDKIKIDQSFVRDIIENPVNAAIATAAIVMARSLNLSVLAEGVETEAQAKFLRGRHCDAMQGYLFSRPLPADQFAPLLLDTKNLPIFDETREYAQTLMLVDDEPNILTSLSRLLRREGYHIMTAESPAEAFEKLAVTPAQVVISDQRMPTMSGTEFLSRVRQLYPDTVRMVLTGYTDLDSVTGAINRGAVYKFLTKPWDDDQLREQIREAFRMVKNIQGHDSPPPP